MKKNVDWQQFISRHFQKPYVSGSLKASIATIAGFGGSVDQDYAA